MVTNKSAYDAREVLVCRKYLKGKCGKCSVNLEYIIKSVKDGSIVLKELHGKLPIVLGLDIIKKHFIHSYCRTCHSFQGSPSDGKITIFDWKFYFVNRKWAHTAVKRATELKNVFLSAGSNDGHDEEMLDKYIVRKFKITRNNTIKMGEP